MTVFRAANLNQLSRFAQRPEALGVFARDKPQEADAFFKKLMRHPFSIAGTVGKDSLKSDIEDLLSEVLPPAIKTEGFYEYWVKDMAEVCSAFCEAQNTDAVGFCIGSQRGCRRYHVDNVPMRLLVTYAGAGTEWLPEEAANRGAFKSGEPNEHIVKDPSQKQFMKAWDISIFRGGPKGLLHRTPDDALTGPSILMRLDHPSFWENIIKRQAVSA